MNWKDLGKQIAGMGLPLLGGAVGGPGGAALGGVLASALGIGSDQPDEIYKAVRSDPQAVEKLTDAELAHRVELEKIELEKYRIAASNEAHQASEIGETMRAELTAPSGYRAGWRPLFGYVSAIGFGAVLAALVYAIIKQPDKTGDIVDSATLVLSLMLGVLGINIRARSQDKQAVLPNRPIGLLESFAKRVRGAQDGS